MADVGTTTSNLSTADSTTPNADTMGVDPSLEALASYIVAAQSAWESHDSGTMNTALQTFWNQENNQDSSTLQNQSYGSLIGGTIQQDIIALDAYSHRMLGYEYMYQIGSATPADIPNLINLEMAQFTLSTTGFASVGLTMQANNDDLKLVQAQGWGADTAAHWVDDSYVTAVKAVIANDVAAASNLISTATSALDFLSNPWILGGAAVLVGLFLISRRK